MKRSDIFLVFSLMLTIILFITYRSPPVLYMGLIYSMAVALIKSSIKNRNKRTDSTVILGIILIAISPIFLIIKIGGYPSPAISHALILIGTSLILFTTKSSVAPNSIAIFEILIATSVRIKFGSTLLTWTSKRFVDITSYIVRDMIKASNLPISMRDNIAIVRNNMIIIGSGCSGLDALVMYILATLFLIYLRKPSKKEASLLLIGALGIIPLNALRIFILLLIGYHSGISFLELFHSHLGDLMFLAYVFLYWWWIIERKRKTSTPPKTKYHSSQQNNH